MKTINKIKVGGMSSPRGGNDVPNQYIIWTDEGRYFQSYQTLIAFVDHSGQITLDKERWNYSVTTSKYRNQFTGFDTNETRKRIADGTIKLEDLN